MVQAFPISRQPNQPIRIETDLDQGPTPLHSPAHNDELFIRKTLRAVELLYTRYCQPQCTYIEFRVYSCPNQMRVVTMGNQKTQRKHVANPERFQAVRRGKKVTFSARAN